MEVLSARMAPVFKGEDSWKFKRVYDDKRGRQSEVKLEQASDRALNYEAAPLRESGHRKLYASGALGWEGGSRQPVLSRSVGRSNAEACHGYVRNLERPQESSEDVETSQDVHPDDSDNSGDDEPVAPETTEALQKWPIIQIVEPPTWLPDGWTAVLRTRESGSKDKYYVDPVSQRRFRSKTEVNYFLQTGKSYRYKRNLALLTKPLKEDPASLPNTVSLRSVLLDVPTSRESVQTLPYTSPSSPYGGEQRVMATVQGRTVPSDLRLSIPSPPGETARKPYNKPGPKPKSKVYSEAGTPPKRHAIEERKATEISQGHGTENRGKLILKLKRKMAEPDEGQRNGKKPRPFEVVVGATSVVQAKSRSSTSDEDERNHKNLWALDHAVDSASRAEMLHSLVPSTHVSRRPMSKAPLPPWRFQSQSSAGSRPQYGSTSNGQGHALERTSGSATVASAEPETPPVPPKKESPAEQLQKLGRKLCQQAVNVLSSECSGGNTLQQISGALHTSMSQHGLNGGFTPTHFTNMFNPAFNSGFHAPAPYQHQQPTKRMRGSFPKGKGTVPAQKYALDKHYSLVPQGQ